MSIIGYLIISFIIILIIGIILENKSLNNFNGISILVGISLFYGVILEIIGNNLNKQKMESMITIIIILLLISILIIIGELVKKQKIKASYELVIIFYPLVISMITILKTTDLLVVFLSLELQGIIFYTLLAYKNKTIFSNEGSLKYFVTGAIASILFILGTSFLYKEILFSSLNLNLMFETKDLSYSLGSILILISLLIKIGASPFHVWLTDVYEGASLHIFLILVIIPKIFLFYFMYIFNKMFTQNIIIIGSIILSSLVGSIGAIKQTKTKRFLAYTVILNNSFFLGLLLVSKYFSLFSLVLSIIIYLLVTMLNIIPLVILFPREFGFRYSSLRDFLSLKKSNFFLALLISCSFLSSGGFPPLIGFFSKFYSIFPIIDFKYKIVVYFLILASIISSYYYLRISSLIFFFKESPVFLIESISLCSGRLLSCLLFFSVFFIFNTSIIVLL